MTSTVPAAHAEELVLRELPGHVTEATLVVDATPEEVYNVVTDYANWPRIFTDVTEVRVLAGGRDHARVRFESRAIGRSVTVELDNVPGQRVRFRGIEGPPGGKAGGEYVLTPIGDGTRTHVRARLYMEVTGAPGWFVSDERVREMRRKKLMSDLRDTARLFADAPR